MVVNKMTVAERFAAPARGALAAGRLLLPRFTRADAAALVRMGMIPEDASTELLDGIIVLKDRSASGQGPAMIGNEHRKCVERFSALRKLIDGPARHVESQQPLVCSETHAPEPDFMVVRGLLEHYPDLATAADAYCVVEVADSSYERDVGAKLVGYARAGVRQYVVVDLRNSTAEVYADPDPAAGTYRAKAIVAAEGSLELLVGVEERFVVSLSGLLP